jgi:ATP-dependent helicase/nuclease subunit B
MDSNSEILDFLAGGGMVVTANSRASRALRREYAERQKQRGVEAWVSVKVLDWASWLGSLWEEFAFWAEESPLVLTRLQERWLWGRALQSQPEAALVPSVDPLAGLAQQAYSLLSEYRAHEQRGFPWSTRDEDSVSDPEAFRRWASAFDKLCIKRHAVSHSKLAQLVAERISSGDIKVAGEIRLVGFDRITPAQAYVIEALKERDCSISLIQPQGSAEHISLAVATNRRDEIATCAEWLRKLLLRAPSSRIAVIVPDVSAVRAEIERTFRRTLAPESMNIAAKPTLLPFEFSLGTSLSASPTARAALLLLRWLAQPLQSEEVSWLLLSGFVAATDTDALELAMADSSLRNSGLMQQEIRLASFISQCRSSRVGAGQRLGGRLLKMQRMLEGPTHRDALAWAELAPALVLAAGWPGVSTPDSIEFQVREKWTRLLESMATLAFDDQVLTYDDFLRVVEREASESIFAAESHDAPIQILGPVESSGQHFDVIWFLGADESSWPTSGKPHPLLPIALQRAAGMPHATAESDWTLARSTTLRIATSAPQLIFSYSHQNEDGVLRPSTLLRELSQKPAPQPTSEFRVEHQIELASDGVDRTEHVADSEDIPWPVELSPGGFAVLKRQSACAFQSFAVKRLGAAELEPAQWGLSAAQRGTLLHAVLDRLWSPAGDATRSIRSRDDLRTAIREGKLDELLAAHIAEVFRKDPATQATDEWSRAYLRAEQTRLHRILTEWLLEHEATREPFTVEACEQELRNVEVGPLHLDLRVDRVDLLPDNARLLIDYKTGETAVSKWSVPRVEEPQLPLYATYGRMENVQGLLFAQIRAGKMKFAGHTRDAAAQLLGNLDGKSQLMKKPLDDSMIAEWRQDLLSLAEDFQRGDATVDPKHYPGTCKYCGLEGLCRVAETDNPSQTLEDESAEAGGNGGIEEDQGNG